MHDEAPEKKISAHSAEKNESADKQQTLPRSKRIRSGRDFDAVYAARTFRRAGPLTIHAMPNECGWTRLGLSVSRRVGKAVVRNRVKRMVREAFRLSQHELPAGYDVVVSARAHEPMELAAYQQHIFDAMTELDAIWRKRHRTERRRGGAR